MSGQSVFHLVAYSVVFFLKISHFSHFLLKMADLRAILMFRAVNISICKRNIPILGNMSLQSVSQNFASSTESIFSHIQPF